MTPNRKSSHPHLLAIPGTEKTPDVDVLLLSGPYVFNDDEQQKNTMCPRSLRSLIAVTRLRVVVNYIMILHSFPTRFFCWSSPVLRSCAIVLSFSLRGDETKFQRCADHGAHN